jgi:hypothetical protein
VIRNHTNKSANETIRHKVVCQTMKNGVHTATGECECYHGGEIQQAVAVELNNLVVPGLCSDSMQ